MYQRTTIIGRVGKDAELNFTPQGIAVAKFSVAVSRVTGKGENKQEDTTWYNVSIWRERAESLCQYIRKGNMILCVGAVKARAYTNRDGEPTASLELTANEVKFLSDRGNGSASSERQSHTEYEEVGDLPF